MAGNPNIREVGRKTRFKPGQSGNPGGPRKGLSITRFIRDELQKPSAEDPAVTRGELFAAVVVDEAIKGDRVWGPLVWRYVDGDPKAAADLSLRELVEQMAERMGLDPVALLAEFERDLKRTGAA